MHTLCLINQKGGCGKSSSCFHLAGAFAERGLRVLLIDADPQGSLSQGFLGSAEVESLPMEQTLAAIFEDSCYFMDRRALVTPTGVAGIDIVPTNQHLAAHNVPTPEVTGSQQFVISDLVDGLQDYDIVLIDCPPNLYLCSWNAMIAASHVLIPVPPEDFGTQGLRAVHQSVEQARQLNPDLRRLGHLISRYDGRLLVHRSYVKQLREVYTGMVLSTIIPELSAFKVALTCRLPVTHHAPKSQASAAVRKLIAEILDQIEHKKYNPDKQRRKVA